MVCGVPRVGRLWTQIKPRFFERIRTVWRSTGHAFVEIARVAWARSTVTFFPSPSTTTRIEEILSESYLYDLNLVTSSGIRQEFWAGEGARFYLVSPEFSVLDRAVGAATTATAILEGLFQACRLNKQGWPPEIIDIVNQFGAGVFHGALIEALAGTPSIGLPAPPAPLYERIDRLYRSLDTATAETAAVVARPL